MPASGKIVTKEERDNNYRIVASIDHPYALSYKIGTPSSLPTTCLTHKAE